MSEPSAVAGVIRIGNGRMPPPGFTPQRTRAVMLIPPPRPPSPRPSRRARAVIAAAAFPLLTSTVVLAQFDAPADYYNPVDTATAISNPALFKDQIHDRI